MCENCEECYPSTDLYDLGEYRNGSEYNIQYLCYTCYVEIIGGKP